MKKNQLLLLAILGIVGVFLGCRKNEVEHEGLADQVSLLGSKLAGNADFIASEKLLKDELNRLKKEFTQTGKKNDTANQSSREKEALFLNEAKKHRKRYLDAIPEFDTISRTMFSLVYKDALKKVRMSNSKNNKSKVSTDTEWYICDEACWQARGEDYDYAMEWSSGIEVVCDAEYQEELSRINSMQITQQQKDMLRTAAANDKNRCIDSGEAQVTTYVHGIEYRFDQCRNKCGPNPDNL